MARLEPAPSLNDLVHAEIDFAPVIGAGIGVAPGGRYRHWDTLRYRKAPAGLSHEQWWFAVKLARGSLLRQLPFKDASKRPFVYTMPDEALELLHFVDQHASGEVAMPEVVTEDASARHRYLVNSLIEEAIRSSQLEGAATTRREAKEMIRSGRQPRDRSELMVYNNYRALEFIRDEVGDHVSPEIVLALHRILTEGTLDDPSAAGRLQTVDNERVSVWDERSNEVVHVPPPADELEGRLDLLCRFANGEINASGFMHPVVRAILLHFFLAYDHPFEDGNGRTARALFYWSMRHERYWLTEYLSISKILREAPARYSRSFQYVATDENDVTYFVLHQLSVIRRAIDELHRYLRRKVEEVKEVERLMRRAEGFNHRQLALLSNAVRHPDQRYTFVSHARSHRVSDQSARNDLLDLTGRGLLTRRRIGRKYVFMPVDEMAAKLGR